MKLALVAAAFVAGSKAEEAADHERPSFPDHIRPDQTSFFTFGSCSKQYLEQPAWREMLKKGPEMFLWVGDAVYAESHHPRGALDAVRDAFAAQSARKDYADFVSNVAVDGVWDDHDYGRNDAGSDFEYRLESQEEFLKFLKVPRSDPRWSQAGVYWSRRFYDGRLQVISLDTRSHRDSHFIPSLGGNNWIPFKGLVAALGRYATARLGLGQQYQGDMLGAAQWSWLESTLANSSTQPPDLTVVLSSVQVTTTNPLVESWGHFPLARKKLLEMLQMHRPKGMLVLSGDVHVGEVISSSQGDNGTLEVTSSGMTHSCGSSVVGFSCQPIIGTLSKHRRQNSADPQFFTGKNFGGLDIDWKRRKFTVSVFDLQGTPMLSASRSFDDKTTIATQLQVSIFDWQEPLMGLVLVGSVLITGVVVHMWIRRPRTSIKQKEE